MKDLALSIGKRNLETFLFLSVLIATLDLIAHWKFFRTSAQYKFDFCSQNILDYFRDLPLAVFCSVVSLFVFSSTIFCLVQPHEVRRHCKCNR